MSLTAMPLNLRKSTPGSVFPISCAPFYRCRRLRPGASIGRPRRFHAPRTLFHFLRDAVSACPPTSAATTHLEDEEISIRKGDLLTMGKHLLSAAHPTNAARLPIIQHERQTHLRARLGVSDHFCGSGCPSVRRQCYSRYACARPTASALC